jgi:hypothetical protein
MARPPTTSVVQALTSFVALIDGADLPVRQGDLADADSAVARKYPDLFGPPNVKFAGAPRVEAATAAPGEKRGA